MDTNPILPEAMPSEPAPLERWATCCSQILNALVDSITFPPERDKRVAGLKTTITKMGFTVEQSRSLIDAGTIDALPDEMAHTKLKQFLEDRKVAADKIAALDMAYHRASPNKWQGKAGNGRANGEHAAHPESDDDTRLLDELRRYPKGTEYERMSPEELNKILNGTKDECTKSAAEYILCYRLRHYKGEYVHDVEEKAGLSDTSFRNWERRNALPDSSTLTLLRESEFFKKTEDADKFEELVISNRRILMTEALKDGHHERLASLLYNMPASFVLEEIKNALYLQPDIKKLWQRHDFATDGGLIATQGLFLHFLRHGLGITKDPVVKETNIAGNVITAIEGDSERYIAPSSGLGRENSSRSKLLTYYERKLAEQADNYPAASELTEILQDHSVKQWLGALPMARRLKSHAATVSASGAASSEGLPGRP